MRRATDRSARGPSRWQHPPRARQRSCRDGRNRDVDTDVTWNGRRERHAIFAVARRQLGRPHSTVVPTTQVAARAGPGRAPLTPGVTLSSGAGQWWIVTNKHRVTDRGVAGWSSRCRSATRAPTERFCAIELIDNAHHLTECPALVFSGVESRGASTSDRWCLLAVSLSDGLLAEKSKGRTLGADGARCR